MFLHCVTKYPTPYNECNLRAVTSMIQNLGGIIGYSDHTDFLHAPVCAVAMGAKIIEKHISLDFNVLNAHDWKVSADKVGLMSLISKIRTTEKMLGNGAKTRGSRKENKWARKNLKTGLRPEK